MVRKIKNGEKEKKVKNNIKPMSMKEKMIENNRIDMQINKTLELVEKSMGKTYADKLNRLTMITGDSAFTERTMKLLLDLYHVYLVKLQLYKKGKINIDPEYIDDINQDMIKIYFKEYEEKYYPKITTIFYTNFFNINKMIDKYFGINLYKERFKEENKGIFNIEEYKKMNMAIKTKKVIPNEAGFTGEWGIQIGKISKELDYILGVLNTYREEYIYMPRLNKVYSDTRKTVKLTNEKIEPMDKKFEKLINRVFKNNPEVKESYYIPIEEKYKNEHDFMVETMMYAALNEDNENLKYLEEALYYINGSKQKTKVLMDQIKSVNTNVHIFMKNFDKLVLHGDDHFDTTIKRAILEVI